MSLVPYVVEQTARGERSYDIFSRLLNDRIQQIPGVISTETLISLEQTINREMPVILESEQKD